MSSVTEAPPAPELSVLICSFDRCETLRRCLDAFEQQSLGPDRYELVVVDDGSSDGTAELLDTRAFRVPAQVIHQRNGGLAAARNAGLAVARGRLVLLVNDDTIAFPDLVQRHLERHARHPEETLAVLGSFEQPPEVLTDPLMRTLESNDMVFCYAHMQAHQRYDWTRFWTCNVSVPTEAVRAAGGFDESFRHYGCEDTDLGIRLHARGIPVHYDPLARAWHHHVLDLPDLERRTRTVARAYVRLFRKHPAALAHRDWTWVAELSRESCERAVDECAEQAGAWRAALEARLETPLAPPGRDEPASREVLQALAEPLRALHRLWWLEGLAQGMRQFGLRSVHELTDDERGVRAVCSWPTWHEAGELDCLLEKFVRPVVGRGELRLCLLHDAEVDGPASQAMAALERAYARHIPDGESLDVVFVTDPRKPDTLASLRQAVDWSLALPSAASGPRAELFGRLGAPQLRSPDELYDALG